ncbi:Zn-ribbon domain-containing OB-fold protein [Amycolatopsis thermoflava]|uniref:Zn-ribbon domain-containing OB-fold protein n=1 Tax=Amycolatopsis thermoflava TaxID=84480 RepID=UPI00381DEAD2
MTRPAYRILPQPTAESAAFWAGGAQGELRIHRCRSCSRYFHPPAGVCFRCHSRDVAPEPVSGRAVVVTFTVNHHPWFGEAFPPPYAVAIVELDEDPEIRLTTQIVGCPVEDVRIGMAVEVVFEQHEDVWIPVFAPRQGSVA